MKARGHRWYIHSPISWYRLSSLLSMSRLGGSSSLVGARNHVDTIPDKRSPTSGGPSVAPLFFTAFHCVRTIAACIRVHPLRRFYSCSKRSTVVVQDLFLFGDTSTPRSYTRSSRSYSHCELASPTYRPIDTHWRRKLSVLGHHTLLVRWKITLGLRDKQLQEYSCLFSICEYRARYGSPQGRV